MIATTRAVASPMKLGLALLGALAVNVALFSLITLLSHERKQPDEEIPAGSISLVSLKPPEPPAEKAVEQPKPPEPKQRVDYQPNLAAPALDFGPPGLSGGIAIDLGIDRLGGSIDENVVFDAFELDTQPEAVVRLQPPYPYRARERGIEGIVQLKLLVNQDGSVGEVTIIAARPEGIFEETVRETVPKWKFSPGKLAGEAVAAWVVTNVRFEFN
jgi:protein TonB